MLEKQKTRQTHHTSEAMSRELDVRDRSPGIRISKRKYNPIPQHSKNKEGKRLALTKGAQQTSEYLSQEQWGMPSTEDINKRQENLITYHEQNRTIHPTRKIQHRTSNNDRSQESS